MRFSIVELLAASVLLLASTSAETLQYPPSEIPAPYSQRFVRSAYGGSSGSSSSYSAPAAAPAYSAPAAPSSSYGGSSSSYGGSSPATIPAPPCPQNYIISCGPSLQPVSCAAPASSSYSAPAAPSYSAPAASPSYSAPAASPSYSAPAASPSYSAPAAPSYSVGAPPMMHGAYSEFVPQYAYSVPYVREFY